ncbi:MAG: ribonuclease H family protein [Saprospiraceae bacterium]
MVQKLKLKYYVVWVGNKPGIYDSWKDCLLQVKAFPNAKYKSFNSLKEAKDAFQSNYTFISKEKQTKLTNNKTQNWQDYVPKGSLTVDAACQGNPGKMEYRGVDPYTAEEVFHVGPLENGTNNIGEFLALVHALALFNKMNNKKSILFTDSATAMSWIRRKKPNTKLKFDSRNQEIKNLLERATNWLSVNSFSNPIQKWETEKWGEIPADFGRK